MSLTTPTEFQRRILAYVMQAPNRIASSREVAAYAFPEQWGKPAGRGALVVNVARAGQALVGMGKLACILPAKDRWGSPRLCGGFGKSGDSD